MQNYLHYLIMSHQLKIFVHSLKSFFKCSLIHDQLKKSAGPQTGRITSLHITELPETTLKRFCIQSLKHETPSSTHFATTFTSELKKCRHKAESKFPFPYERLMYKGLIKLQYIVVLKRIFWGNKIRNKVYF